MSESEFKKHSKTSFEITDIVNQYSKEGISKVPREILLLINSEWIPTRLLDEARKEIFLCVLIEELKGLTKDNPELVNVLLKWFGSK